MATISIKLTSTPTNELLEKLAGNVVYSEAIPAILEPHIAELIPNPVDLSVEAFLGFKGSDFEASLTITDNLSVFGIPADFSINLFDIPLGFIGAAIARLKFGSGASETLTAVLAVEA